MILTLDAQVEKLCLLIKAALDDPNTESYLILEYIKAQKELFETMLVARHLETLNRSCAGGCCGNEIKD